LETTDFSGWAPAFLKMEKDAAPGPDASAKATRLVEDTADSYRNITTAINVTLPMSFSVSSVVRPGPDRVLRVFAYAGPDRVICDFDPRTMRSGVIAIGAATAKSCEIASIGDGWVSARLVGRLEQGSDMKIAIAMMPSMAHEQYVGDGSSYLDISKVVVSEGG